MWEIRRWVVGGVCFVNLAGVPVVVQREYHVGIGEHVSPDAGQAAGTVLHSAARDGFVTLDSRSVVPRTLRYQRGLFSY